MAATELYYHSSYVISVTISVTQHVCAHNYLQVHFSTIYFYKHPFYCMAYGMDSNDHCWQHVNHLSLFMARL